MTKRTRPRMISFWQYDSVDDFGWLDYVLHALERMSPLIMWLVLAGISLSSHYENLPPQWLFGVFEASHSAIGTWQLQPVRCLSGYERRWPGILFLFAEDSPVRELWLSDAGGMNRVIARLVLAGGDETVEAECDEVDAEVDWGHVLWQGREVHHGKGYLRISCSQLNLKGQASFDGCWPTLSK